MKIKKFETFVNEARENKGIEYYRDLVSSFDDVHSVGKIEWREGAQVFYFNMGNSTKIYEYQYDPGTGYSNIIVDQRDNYSIHDEYDLMKFFNGTLNKVN